MYCVFHSSLEVFLHSLLSIFCSLALCLGAGGIDDSQVSGGSLESFCELMDLTKGEAEHLRDWEAKEGGEVM